MAGKFLLEANVISLIRRWPPVGFYGSDSGISGEDLVLKCHW